MQLCHISLITGTFFTACSIGNTELVRTSQIDMTTLLNKQEKTQTKPQKTTNEYTVKNKLDV